MSKPYPRQLDTIYLRNLNLSAIIGPDAWGREGKVQPIVLNVRLKIDTTSASTSDDINDSFSYGQVCKEITNQLDGKAFNNLQHLITVLTTFAAFWPGEDTKLQALAPKALLRVEGGLEITHSIRKKERYEENGVPQVRHVDTRSWSIKGLKLACIIGVNKHERLEKQSVNVDLRIPAINPRNFEAKEGSSENWRTLVKRVCEVVEYSSFETLEALAARIAKTALDSFPVDEITVSVEKPSALTFVEGAGVEVTRRKGPYVPRPESSDRASEASRPRMTLDQYKRVQTKDISTPSPRGHYPQTKDVPASSPKAIYPPMHQAPTNEQFQDMKSKVDGTERFVPTAEQYQEMTRKRSGAERYIDSAVTSPRSLPSQSPTPNAQRSISLTSSRNKPNHSVSQSADSASYYVDGSVDQASPIRSHDFAKTQRAEVQQPPSSSSPESQHSYLNGQYDYESAIAALTPPRGNNESSSSPKAIRVSDSSSMFGTVPSKTGLESVQPPFSVDGTDKETTGLSATINNPGMPGTYQETPKPSKSSSLYEKKPENSYFDADGEVKEGVGNHRDDVSIGEAF
ncbi:MAG: hypothetical protein L6R41_005227 [Letrouitia leprolyta]|nr:MAG: hypothetical protein L6R41_005227 [Letrouitia leprolyta]